jgi:hypothetical protein
VIWTVVVVDTVPACTLKLALVCPAGTRYDDCTPNAAELLPFTLTDAPPLGAGPLSVNVSVAVAPDTRVAGLTVRELNDTALAAGGVMVTVAEGALLP